MTAEQLCIRVLKIGENYNAACPDCHHVMALPGPCSMCAMNAATQEARAISAQFRDVVLPTLMADVEAALSTVLPNGLTVKLAHQLDTRT